MTKNKFIELLQRNLGKEVNLEEVIESTVILKALSLLWVSLKLWLNGL